MKNKLKFVTKILVLIFLLFLLFFLLYITYSSFINKYLFEKYVANIIDTTSSNAFAIDKIVLFSSCNSDSTINSNNTSTINNLIQYTDIAIFINNNEKNFSLENTLSSACIKDISYNVTPKLGTPKLYYKDLNDFATDKIFENNIINSDLNFSISTEDEIDYSTPVLFNNCANPITLSYVNSGIVNNYTISDTSITHDGTLLQKCNVILDDLTCNLSFTIYVENNLGERFKCPIYIDIPFENENSSIYNGSFTYTYNPNTYFFKY